MPPLWKLSDVRLKTEVKSSFICNIRLASSQNWPMSHWNPLWPHLKESNFWTFSPLNQRGPFLKEFVLHFVAFCTNLLHRDSLVFSKNYHILFFRCWMRNVHWTTLYEAMWIFWNSSGSKVRNKLLGQRLGIGWFSSFEESFSKYLCSSSRAPPFSPSA